VLNAAARLTADARKFDHVTPLLANLHWLRVPECIQYKLCVLVYRILNGAAPQYLSELIQPLSDVDSRRRLRSADCIYSWSSSAGYAALNHWRPCSCRRRSTCLEQSSSRSAPIRDIFYFQNTPKVTSVQHILPFSLTVPLTIFVQSPWSRFCCIRLSKLIIITLYYQTAWQFRREPPPPLTGALNAGGVGRNRDSEPIFGFTACYQSCDRPGVINMAPPDHLCYCCRVVSGGVCWWRETTTKCLWQEVSTLRQRQQNSI